MALVSLPRQAFVLHAGIFFWLPKIFGALVSVLNFKFLREGRLESRSLEKRESAFPEHQSYLHFPDWHPEAQVLLKMWITFYL